MSAWEINRAAFLPPVVKILFIITAINFEVGYDVEVYTYVQVSILQCQVCSQEL